MVGKIAELRNSRLEFTTNAHGFDSGIYHCILREKGKLLIFEEPMNPIDIPNIKISNNGKGSIVFNDGKTIIRFFYQKARLQNGS